MNKQIGMANTFKMFQKAWINVNRSGLSDILSDNVVYKSKTQGKLIIGKDYVTEYLFRIFKMLSAKKSTVVLLEEIQPSSFKLRYLYFDMIYIHEPNMPTIDLNSNNIELIENNHLVSVQVQIFDQKVTNIQVDQKVLSRCRKTAFHDTTFASLNLKDEYKNEPYANRDN